MYSDTKPLKMLTVVHICLFLMLYGSGSSDSQTITRSLGDSETIVSHSHIKQSIFFYLNWVDLIFN